MTVICTIDVCVDKLVRYRDETLEIYGIAAIDGGKRRRARPLVFNYGSRQRDRQKKRKREREREREPDRQGSNQHELAARVKERNGCWIRWGMSFSCLRASSSFALQSTLPHLKLLTRHAFVEQHDAERPETVQNGSAMKSDKYNRPRGLFATRRRMN